MLCPQFPLSLIQLTICEDDRGSINQRSERGMIGAYGMQGMSAKNSSSLVLRLKRWALVLRRNVLALWLAARDPRVPWHAKLAAGAVAGYALSPIDLIPDFIPVLGYLDDLVVLPLGIMLAVKLVPTRLMDEFRAEAERQVRPVSRGGLVAILLIWMGIGILLAYLLWLWEFGNDPVVQTFFAG